MKKLVTSAMLAAVVAVSAFAVPGAVLATGNWPDHGTLATGNWPDAGSHLTATGNWPDSGAHLTATGNWPDAVKVLN